MDCTAELATRTVCDNWAGCSRRGIAQHPDRLRARRRSHAPDRRGRPVPLRAGPEPGAKVVDLGCGSGWLARHNAPAAAKELCGHGLGCREARQRRARVPAVLPKAVPPRAHAQTLPAHALVDLLGAVSRVTHWTYEGSSARYAPVKVSAASSRAPLVICSWIQAYVFASPASSGIDGSQPSFSRISVLSLLRPRTPSGASSL